ncbi:MAG: epimerase [Pseudomonadota bacterium]
MTRTALILGASGRLGRHAAEAFAKAGWTINRFDRRTDDLMGQARRAGIIVNGWNPAYPDWAALMPDLHARVQEAALAADIPVILPGNVYVYGPATPAPWSATSPHAAQNPLGRLRIEMEQSYRRSGARTILLRAGDFLDTQASGNWFDQILAARIRRGHFTYPGDLDTPHAWAYLPDLARAMVDLAGRSAALPPYLDLPFPGYTLTGREMADHLGAITGKRIKIKRFAWWGLSLARPVWPLARHILEMRYLWTTPHWLDGSAYRALCPDLADTPVETALASAIRDL